MARIVETAIGRRYEVILSDVEERRAFDGYKDKKDLGDQLVRYMNECSPVVVYNLKEGSSVVSC